MTDLFFSKLNEDGSYGKPIKVDVIDINLTTQEVNDSTPIFSFDEGMEASFKLDYKQTKDFVWNFILNLKRSTKNLVSKNIWRGKKNDG